MCLVNTQFQSEYYVWKKNCLFLMQWFLFTVWFLIWKVCLNNLVAVAFCKKSASTVCETSCCHKLRAYDAQTSPTWLSIFQSKWKCLPNTVDVLFPYLIWDTNNTSNACQLHAHSMKLISMHGMTFTCCMNHSCLKITVRVLWVDIDGLKRQMALWIIMRANRLRQIKKMKRNKKQLVKSNQI